MVKYVCLVKLRLESFVAWKLEHIPRGSNEKVNALAAMVVSLTTKETVLLLVYYQPESSITANQVNEIKEACSSWMTPIVCYPSSGELPNIRVEVHKIQVKAVQFLVVNGQLYKRSQNSPYLKCHTTQQGQYALAELHEGICGNHPGGRTLAHRAHTQGYYWPTMRADAATYVRKCWVPAKSPHFEGAVSELDNHNKVLAFRLLQN